MWMALGFDSTYRLDAYFHTRDQIFFPNRNNVHGSTVVPFDTREFLDESNATLAEHQAKLELTKVEERSLDRPGRRCSNDGSEESFGKCFVRFIEKKIGCS